ncbi:MAG: type II toxin-antitoxin system VapC family toxin [Gammaproteobacteria bacterium]|nr:MAG: type II toxin-antitoxin system VapC family toxin [Gammaproteobacteria bacterium]
MLVDTDVLIWHLRGYSQAAQCLDRLPQLMLSAMSYLELLQGMHNKEELTAVQKMFALRHANVLPLTAAITQRATELMTTLTLSHGLQAGDALIAATALEHQLPLLTGNSKHFTSIAGLNVEKFALS